LSTYYYRHKNLKTNFTPTWVLHIIIRYPNGVKKGILPFMGVTVCVQNLVIFSLLDYKQIDPAIRRISLPLKKGWPILAMQ
jgi:hypothetical protein